MVEEAHMLDETELSELASLAAAGDRRAAERVLREVHPRIVRYCRMRLGSNGSVSANDVAQEVALAVISALPRYQDRGRPFMSFVYGIASHKVIDAYRSGGRDLSWAVEEVPETEDTGDSPEDAVISAANGNEIRELLDTLGDRARDIIILRVFEGFSAEETGEIVGASAGAVRVAQHRALSKMRSILEKQAEEAK